MSHSILLAIVILLAISVVCVALFRRWNMPPVLAYLLVGMVLGPFGASVISDNENTRFLAEFGVVFLMFTVGLEFSLPQLMAMRKDVFGIGGAQVLLTALIVTITLLLLDVSFESAVIIGGVMALSSTAIVIKQLTEQMELNSRHGHLSVAILIFQDLAVIPFLIIIPALAGDVGNGLAWTLVIAVLKGVLVIGVMLAAGHWLLRPLFYEIAKQHSSELFTLMVLLFSVAAAWVTDMAGLSLALGAFIAGMMLSETEFRHQVEVDIRPFRDVLMGLFFITIGMLLDFNALLELLPWVLASVVGLMLVKVVVIMGICAVYGVEKGVSSRTALSLAQGGEFGFAILAIALSNGVLEKDISQIVLASVILSMIISPFLIRNNGFVAKRWFANSYMGSRKNNVEAISSETRSLDQHVIICGYGRIGQNIAKFLKQENFEYVALDLDPVIVKEAHDAGEKVFYGDSTHINILRAVKINRARVVVVSYDDFGAASSIISHIKSFRPDMPILVRTRDDSHLTELQSLGATEVVPETLEASLMLSSYLLMLLDVPMKRVVRNIQTVRESRYQLLHELFHGQAGVDVSDSDTQREGLHSFTIPGGAYCIGKRLSELPLDECNVKVTSLRHDGICHQKPDEDSLLAEGDVLVMYATPEDSEHAQSILLTG